MAALEQRSAALLKDFKSTRERTLYLVKNLERDDFVVQTAPYTSPPKWHLGHVSWLYEVILGKADGNYRPYSEDFAKYLNSYYHQFGVPHDKDKRGIVSRPTTDQMLEYYDQITARVLDYIRSGPGRDATHLLTMGVHHECQHQELLVYDLQHLLAGQYRPPVKNGAPEAGSIEPQMVTVRGGLYGLGNSGEEFCYDIEMPEHRVYLEDYRIDAYPVTNGQYMEFIADGGYNDFKYWLSDGWEKVNENGWQAPMYWTRQDGRWFVDDFAGRHEVNPDQPVCHVSYYEADAYCRWAGRRLPTEAEWEKAACWDSDADRRRAFPWGDAKPDAQSSNLLESYLWQTAGAGAYPRGASPSGCHQMIGDVWEWTSSEFVGYPGFRSGFSEYNDKWFGGQKVLRGGSFGTPQVSIRTSYRNFFRMDERWLFAGFRCAADI